MFRGDAVNFQLELFVAATTATIFCLSKDLNGCVGNEPGDADGHAARSAIPKGRIRRRRE